MKSFKLILIIIGIFIAVFSTLLVLEVRTFSGLKEAIAEKSSRIAEAKKTQKESTELEQEVLKLQQEVKEVEYKIPKGEVKPLRLFEEITLLAYKQGMKNVSFTSGEEEDGEAPLESAGAPEEFDEDYSAAPGAPNSIQVKPLVFTMECESEYQTLLTFLKELFAMERIVTVESVRVERVQDLIPRQKVTLKLTTYTFTGQ